MARRGLDRQAVVVAAVALLDAEGPDGLNLSTLAERLGVRTPSLYKHIAGLDGLKRSVALWGLQELARQIARAAVGKSGGAAVLAIAEAYRAFALAHPGVYPLTLRAPGPEDQALAAAGQEVVSLVADVFAACGLDPETTVHTIRGFRALVHGFVSLEAAGGFGMPVDVEASFRHVVGSFIAGLA